THLKPSVTPDPRWPTEILRENRRRGARKRPRGKRAGVRNRLRARAHRAPLPSILLANVQSLDNKLDDLRARIKFQRDIRDCNLLCFTESWLNPAVPNHAIQPAEFFSVHRMDRTADSGKSRGSGVCVMVNNSWCNNANVVTLACSCSPNLELLALKLRPFYLPREFTSVIINTVYIPPQANMDTALWELHEALTQFQAQHRDAALIVVGDFNSANLKRAVPNLYQHVTFPTRGNRTLDHCYTPYKDSYKALAHPPFGKSDHAAIFLLPKYKQRLKREAPVQREVTRWTDQSVAVLQNALDDADWDMFRRSTDDVSEFTEAVVGFIGKLVDDTIPRITIKKFSNQKPWVDRTICEALNSRIAAYNEGITCGNIDEYKSVSYGVRRAVREAKRRYGKKLETQFQQSGSRSLWQGLRMIMDYRSPPSGLMSADESLANELNTFFARFEATSSSANASSTNANGAPQPPSPSALELLRVVKTKELIVDCSKKQERHYQPVRISGTTVERVDSFRYLGVHISQDLSWSRHTSSLAKKARQRLYHLRHLRDFRLPSKVLRNFYTCTIESILTGNITVWFGNSTKQDRQALQRVVRSAERITHTELPDLQTTYYKRCQTKARKIVKDPTHPNNRLFSLL
ncbi:hypothetical protein P4O66_021277, partial [Electrophorus voltai]